MHHLPRLSILVFAGATLASAGCKKKDADAAPGSDSAHASASGSASASATASSPGGSSAASSKTSSAAGGDVAGLKPVTDCPKSLSGHDDGVDRTIKKECGTVVVSGDYDVEGKLTIEGGVTLAFQPGAQLLVGYSKQSKLIVQGTAQAPVTFTAAGDKVAGSWKGVHLYEHADRSSLDGLVLEFAGDKAALIVDAKTVTLANTTVRDANQIGVLVDDSGSITGASGLTFERAGKIPLSLPASTVGALGPSTFKDQGSYVLVHGHHVTDDATWQNPGTYYRVSGDIDVEGDHTSAKLVIAAGTELRFEHDARLFAGYIFPGVIDVEGTADKPVLLRATDDGNDRWKGVGVYDHGELDLEHATVTGANQDQDTGAVWGDGGILSIKDSALSGDTLGLSAKSNSKVKTIAATTFADSDKAWTLYPEQVAAVAADNSYGKGEVAEILAGTVGHDATWHPQAGLDEHVKGELQVNGAKLTLEPGVELAFDDVKLSLGYTQATVLTAEGTADKPIVLRGVRDDKNAWPGIAVYSSANDVRLSSVTIENAGGDAAIVVDERGHATVTNLTCKGCAAAIKYSCQGKVTTTGIKMDGGGTAELKPPKC